jgi:predicted DNA-binding transcriptional regulator AlpA
MPNTNQKHQPRNKVTYIPRPLPAEGYIRKPSFLAALGISSTGFDNGIKAGWIPPGKLLGSRCRVWSVAEVRALLESIESGAAA